MSKTKITNEQASASHEPKKHGCCGGGHAKDQQTQPVRKEQAHDDKHEHAHHSDGGSGCCGGGRASK